MSTTINIYPTTNIFPLVEETRARSQELFQSLLHQYMIESTIEIKAFYTYANYSKLHYAELDLRWTPGLEIGFSYWIDGKWDSSSWPSCLPVEDDDLITAEDLIYPFSSKPEHLGQWAIVEEFEDVLPPEVLKKLLAQDHYWSEYRNVATPAVASIGYGFVAIALAEATNGILASFDGAFEEPNIQTAQDFLSWWGERHVGLLLRS